jgi:hypothetical protein
MVEIKNKPIPKEMIEKYQCHIWLRLIKDSMKDFDNRTIRKEILAHVYYCEHPTCQQVARMLEGIMK